MDLGLYASVLWRFRWIVVLGTLLAVSLTVLSVAKVTSNGLTYQGRRRGRPRRLLLTQPGFPEGRALFPDPEKEGSAQVLLHDPGRFASLTALYSQFAQSDEVRALVRREGASRIVGFGSPGDPGSSNPYALLPVIALFGASSIAQ